MIEISVFLGQLLRDACLSNAIMTDIFEFFPPFFTRVAQLAASEIK